MLNYFEKILIGDEDWNFIPEIMLRTLLMYLVVLIGLRILGKRGIKQLSIFELVVIISLGSAAGDPMFYREIGIISAIAVFSVVILAYKITSYFVSKSKKVETLLEGSCTCVIENGRFAIENFKKEALAQDQFFAELRLKSISHLGQVKLAILETSGSISLFFYPDADVKNGLPILPALFVDQKHEIKYKDYYSCAFCGVTELLEPTVNAICKCCKRNKWVKSIDIVRIG